MAEPSPEPSILETLRTFPNHGLITRPDFNRRMLQGWVVRVRFQLEKIYGTNNQYLDAFPAIPENLPETAARPILTQRLEQLHRIIEDLESLVSNSVSSLSGRRIFIGHGRSLVWLLLKDFILEQLKLEVDEFNREEMAGIATSERLETMLSQAAFAFLVMTAEDEQADGSTRARQNVIHEVGLFQGRLSFRRAIVMLEDGCSEFSNIHGLGHMQFPRGDIAARFENVRRVLERERLI